MACIVFQNGIRRQQRHSMTPPASATAVSGDRYTNIATQLEDRKTRLRKSDVGSEAWLAECTRFPPTVAWYSFS